MTYQNSAQLLRKYSDLIKEMQQGQPVVESDEDDESKEEVEEAKEEVDDTKKKVDEATVIPSTKILRSYQDMIKEMSAEPVEESKDDDKEEVEESKDEDDDKEEVDEGGITLLPPDPNDPMANLSGPGKDAIKKVYKDKKVGYGKGKVDPRLARASKKRYTDVGAYHDDS